MSPSIARNYHNTGLNSTKRRPRRKTKAITKTVLPMAPVFSEFLKANESAFTNILAPPFSTTNPQPSIANRASRGTAVRDFKVPAGQEFMIRIGTTDTVSMDGNAYHTQAFIDVFAIHRWSGPYVHWVAGVPVYPSLGMFVGMAAIGAIHSPLLTNHTPLIPQTEWPIATDEVDGPDTQRYVPTCWSIQAVNQTVIGSRGGDFVTCLPSSTSALLGIRLEDLVKFGSYREHAESEVDFHVPARPVDLAYRHLEKASTTAPLAHMTNAAGYLGYRNTTAVEQTIRIYAGTKYTIAGGKPAALLNAADHAPNHAGHYENVSAAVTAGTIHPAGLSATGKVVMEAISQGKSVLEAIGEKAVAISKSAATKVALAGVAAAGFH